jgi:hypothetical protein
MGRSQTVASDQCLVTSGRTTARTTASGLRRRAAASGRCFGLALALLLFSPLFTGHFSLLYCQSGNAAVTGIVTDPQKAIIVGAKVAAINVGTNVRYEGTTNSSGDYYIASLPPGTYRIEVEKLGFKTDIQPSVVLHTQDALEINFEMALGSASESITVNAEPTNESPAVSMTVDREFVENMPLNGRSIQDLIQLAPGTASGQSGYYSVDGQMTNANNFTVDGVSANLGGSFNTGGSTGQALNGDAPMQTVLGTTQSLASIDSLQEFKIQTSSYTAEYGRNPGGQVSLTTRSGTNDIHGTLFEYLRNTAFDARSYAENYYDEPKAAEHQNDYGGTVGGPIVIPKLYDGKDKTFFFVSYERLRLLTPASETEYVPTQAFRDWASPTVRPYLNASPLPNPNSPGNQDGCTIPNPTTGQSTACDALFTHSYSTPGDIDNISVRLDQNIGQRFHIFLRYADTPSSQTTGAENVESESIKTQTWTAGLTVNLLSSLVNELRLNYSRDTEDYVHMERSVGGSVPLERSLLIPLAYESTYAGAESYVTIPGSSVRVLGDLGGGASVQHQFQLVDSLAWTHGKHSFKFGADWRRLTPTFVQGPYESLMESTSLSSIEEGYATAVEVTKFSSTAPVFDNVSLFVQDHWNLGARLSVDYGLRWELNPPPGPANGEYPAVLNSNNLATATIAPLGTPPYRTRFDKFAPRFGFAWNAIPSRRYSPTIRGGFGIFYDTGQNVIGGAYTSSFPFGASSVTIGSFPLPLSSGVLAPPPPITTIAPPYSFGESNALTSPDLTLPYTEQWSLSLDESLNSRNTLTVSYVGNSGRKLLFTQEYFGAAPGGNPSFPNGLVYTSNASKSSYNALQVQDVGRISQGLNIVASFTYAHALDNASTEDSELAPQWGNSDNDLPRVLNLALNYQTPTSQSSGWMRALTRDWVIANRFSAQSGYPLNLAQTDGFLPDGSAVEYNPDLISGVPIYLHGSSADVGGQPVPGNWRLNPAAFAPVPADPSTGLPVRQGTLERNFVRGPGFYAWNTAVQRSFPIHEQLHLLFRVEAFNILNHPNLTEPDTYLPDSTFGQLIYGQTTTIGVNNQLYSMGAPRSLQFSLKLQF